MKPKTLSVTWRARLLNGALSSLALVALVALAQSRIRTVLYNAVDEAVTSQAQTMLERHDREGQGPPEFRRPGGFGEPGRPDDFGPRRRGPGPRGGFVIRFGSTALLPPRFVSLEPTKTSPQDPPWSSEGVAAATKRGSDLREITGPDGRQILHVYSRRSQGFVLQTAADLAQTNLALGEIQNALYGLILPVGLLMALLGALLTDIAFAPIRKLTRAAAALQPTDLSERLPTPGGNDTFDQLVTVLNAMLGRLEAAFARQKRFTADASHELRTPLAVIKAGTSFLLELEDPLTERQRRTLSRADRTVDRANTLVSDLLLLARSEKGRFPVAGESVLLAELLAEASYSAETGQPSPHAPVLLSAPREYIVTDPKLLHRLIVNLVSNALRHTPPEGSIRVEAMLGDTVVLTVTDTGEGIAPEHLERLGEPFYRPDASRAREHGGVGLGLALCKEIAAALGGDLSLTSTLGEGTTVTVTLPRHAIIFPS